MLSVLSKQSGESTQTSASGVSGTISITAVDTSKAVVFFSVGTTDNNQHRVFRHSFCLELTNATTLTWTRQDASSAADTRIAWTVIELEGLTSVQRGRVDNLAGTSTAVTLSALSDMSRAVSLHCINTGNLEYPLNQQSRREITSTTQLTLSYGSTISGNDAAWQVIEFASGDVSVSRGTVDITDYDETADVTITAVDTTKATVIDSFKNGTSTVATAFKIVGGVDLISSTSVRAYRGNTGSSSYTTTQGYEIAEWVSANIQRGALSFVDTVDSAVTSATFSPTFDDSRSVIVEDGIRFTKINPFLNFNFDEHDHSFTLALDVTAGQVQSVTATRTSTVGTIDRFYNVIEFPAGGETVTATMTGIGTVGLTAVVNRFRSLSPSGVGTPVLSKVTSRSRGLTFSGVGSSALSRATGRAQTQTFSGVGTSALNSATIGTDVNVQAGHAALALTTYQATVSTDVNVQAGHAALTLTTYPASLGTDVNVSANHAALTLTEYPATISTDVNVQAGHAALTLTTYPASLGSDVNVSASHVALTLTTHPATISTDVNVQAGHDALALTTYPAAISQDTDVQAGHAALTLTERPATITVDVNVLAQSAALSLTTYAAAITATTPVSLEDIYTLLLAQQTLIDEIYQRLGLDAANPKTITELAAGSSYDETVAGNTLQIRKVGDVTTVTKV